MFANNIIIIITITTVLYLHVFTLVHYLMHLLGLKFTNTVWTK